MSYNNNKLEHAELIEILQLNSDDDKKTVVDLLKNDDTHDYVLEEIANLLSKLDTTTQDKLLGLLDNTSLNELLELKRAKSQLYNKPETRYAKTVTNGQIAYIENKIKSRESYFSRAKGWFSRAGRTKRTRRTKRNRRTRRK